MDTRIYGARLSNAYRATYPMPPWREARFTASETAQCQSSEEQETK